MKTIGKIKEIYKDESFPSIHQLIQQESPPFKEEVLRHLKKGKTLSVAAGYAKDVITGESIPGELCFYTDGVFYWRSDVIYYFEKYNIQLESDFLDHIIQKQNPDGNKFKNLFNENMTSLEAQTILFSNADGKSNEEKRELLAAYKMVLPAITARETKDVLDALQ